MKSYADLAAIWRRVDEEVASTPMPEEYASWVAHILCNDCNQVGSLIDISFSQMQMLSLEWQANWQKNRGLAGRHDGSILNE